MPIANPIFAIICSITQKKGKKNHRLFALLIVPVASIYSRVHLFSQQLLCTTFFDQAILWPPGQTIQQAQIYKGCYTPPCLYW